MAQIIFTQTSLHKWRGRLLNPSKMADTSYHGLPVSEAFYNISEHPQTGVCTVTVQGRNAQARRYTRHSDLHQAQKAGISWAKKRFSTKG